MGSKDKIFHLFSRVVNTYPKNWIFFNVNRSRYFCSKVLVLKNVKSLIANCVCRSFRNLLFLVTWSILFQCCTLLWDVPCKYIVFHRWINTQKPFPLPKFLYWFLVTPFFIDKSLIFTGNLSILVLRTWNYAKTWGLIDSWYFVLFWFQYKYETWLEIWRG